MEELNRAIDDRIGVEIAFIEAMKQEFQRIQHSLNACIERHPEDYQLALIGDKVNRISAMVPYTYPPSLRNRPFTRKQKQTKLSSTKLSSHFVGNRTIASR
jgi:hypothetical protein